MIPSRLKSWVREFRNLAPAAPRRERISRSIFATMVAHSFWRELAVLVGFALLTIVMTWPWARHWRDTVTDLGDPYTIAYTLWWDYHATFNQPTRLFDATIFYPYRDTLAFSEHDYGIALPFFPLFAAGAPPLTIHSLATLLAFAFSAYGAFRLTRTVTGSAVSGWIAGIAFGFVPYRFQRLPHLHYIFAGWLPLVFEALVLFVRQRSWRRAGWFAAAFTMNGLTCITWLILGLLPLALAGLLLILWNCSWRDPKLWLRGALALLLSGLLLLPFLLPYWRVAAEHRFVRHAGEIAIFSPTLRHWFAASRRSKVWEGLGRDVQAEEMSLFPGLLAPLLSLFCLLFVQRNKNGDEVTETNRQGLTSRNFGNKFVRARGEPRVEAQENSRHSRWLKGLTTLVEVGALLCAGTLLLAAIHGKFTIELFGVRILKASHPGRALILGLLLLALRWVLSHTNLFQILKARGISCIARPGPRGQAMLLALVWIVPGFFGSFGTNFFFHRLLFEYVPLFRSIRVPARWGMIAFVGLSVLAGLGARELAEFIARRARLLSRSTVVAVISVAVIADLWVAPLALVRGQAHPDALTLHLRETPMRGGLVYLPVFGARGQTFEHMVRAADHGKPLITATSSFLPPLVRKIETLAQQRPVQPKLLDVLESVPTSYLVLDYSQMTLEEIEAIRPLTQYGLNSDRLRFRGRFEDRGTKDLFAVTKVEPDALAVGAYTPPRVRLITVAQPGDESLVVDNLSPEVSEGGTLLYRLYKVSYGRPPTYEEFKRDLPVLTGSVGFEFTGWHQRLVDSTGRFAELLVTREEFKKRYGSMTGKHYLEAVTANAGSNVFDRARREQLAAKLSAGEMTRAGILVHIASDQKFVHRESDAALVTMHYFSFLERDPDPAGFAAWMHALRTIDRDSLTRSFTGSIEYQQKRQEAGR